MFKNILQLPMFDNAPVTMTRAGAVALPSALLARHLYTPLSDVCAFDTTR